MTTLSNKYLKHTWAHPKLTVSQSPISGKGVFAAKNLRKGEILMIWGGKIIPVNKYLSGKYRDETLVQIDENHYLGLTTRDKSDSIDEFLNHSCNPNSWLIDGVTLEARRNINKGEEITLDSVTWDSDENWPYTEDGKCRCGSNNCRKILSPNDYMRADLQKKYAGHFSPYIESKIKNLKKKA
ncbi:hypothetical protein A3D05_00840 [Candidatus Gottesmanbacteria bacterium RIFCSPHIGHO2_02_FULL_40_24]|uniref:SET domain-containing protein-lysine N-methyltransferase n=1 Tax=Candidatus Gottesmanbacteria bacterium RIFCSPHIGHO2_01_FULL_40_15 TaxID=1798376 RepID=A0A1F5Z6F5_9BACT|nr:MAG: hypothetical protein A2777_01150 [Candidatus Gottesmanbacteria bacterium RIFCSPHIGHO2_01_FULL_40_15]OGG18284.1 MAG: hypothetical protein A3D05_00840 [Candidatus Gottesmanbacteria bacterium RIFCSPHIGHO2_02_FULL_40_24]OGG22471.1 MAG: hypothetical protein A3B48_04305 [Candidatus Gottesmanbacteria bacterium RIFCSPLOWO2_01_FULL_40_10]OGG24843.1 MAG: hypothetical protein A3E42_01930 [Candidatus Gottesmanbacteria bacterium RIFCSPHIGHO2_12_FULL_40_13]OGG32174.1 MAG: hypothetical protein A3I80_0